MARKKMKGLAEPEGAGFSVRRAGAAKSRRTKKKSDVLPVPRKGEKLPFPPFLPDDPVEAERLVRAEIKRRLEDVEAGKTKLMTLDQADAALRRHMAKRRKGK